VLFSTVFAVFSDAFKIHLGIDWKLFYLIIFFNSFFLVKKNYLKINFVFLKIIVFVLLHGLILYTYLDIPIFYLISQILGISFLGFYFYTFFLNYNIKEIINCYLKLVIITAYVGYILYFMANQMHVFIIGDLRFHSFLSEPALYVITIIPACYFFLKNKEYKKFLIVFGTIILSESSIGLIGCLLMFIIPYLNLKKIAYLLMLIPLLLTITYLIYVNNENVKIRFDDTYKSLVDLKTGKFDENINISTYAILSNLNVAGNNFIDHPLGSGIGSSYYMYDTYYKFGRRAPKYIQMEKADMINANDACALSIRLFSELGIFGLIFIFAFFKNILSSAFSEKYFLEQGIAIYLLLKFYRYGHYFTPEFYFFIWLFYFSLKESKKINVDLLKSKV